VLFVLLRLRRRKKEEKKREKKREKKESTACYFDKEGNQGINQCRIRSARSRKISIVGTWRVLLSTLSITRDQRDIESSLKRLFVKTGFFVALRRREDESRVG